MVRAMLTRVGPLVILLAAATLLACGARHDAGPAEPMGPADEENQYVVWGIVYDAMSGEPIAGARVEAWDDIGPVGPPNYTRADGWYSFFLGKDRLGATIYMHAYKDGKFPHHGSFVYYPGPTYIYDIYMSATQHGEGMPE